MGLSWDDRLTMGREEGRDDPRKIWPYLLVGIGLVAAIHGWLPADWFADHASGWWGVPLAVVIGVPLYSNAAGVLPLVEALHDKGLPMGSFVNWISAFETGSTVPRLIASSRRSTGTSERNSCPCGARSTRWPAGSANFARRPRRGRAR